MTAKVFAQRQSFMSSFFPTVSTTFIDKVVNNRDIVTFGSLGSIELLDMKPISLGTRIFLFVV